MPEEDAAQSKGAPSDVEQLRAKLAERESAMAKMSQKFTEVERQRNQYESGLVKLRSSIEETGLGEVDEHWRVKPKGKAKDEDRPVDESIALLERDLDNGDIDEKTFVKKTALLYGQRAKAEAVAEANKHASDTRSADKTKESQIMFHGKISKEYPEALMPGSLLYKEMEVNLNRPEYSHLSPENNKADYYVLAEATHGRLMSSNDEYRRVHDEKRRPRTNNNAIFDALTNQGVGGVRSGPSEISKENKDFLVDGLGFDKNALDRLNKVYQKSGNDKNGRLYLR